MLFLLSIVNVICGCEGLNMVPDVTFPLVRSIFSIG